MSIIQQTRRLLIRHQVLFATQKRFNRREAIHRHVEPSKFKKHMLSAAEPYFKKVYQLPEETCKGVGTPDRELLPLEKILSKELLEDINKSDFILVIQYNYTPFQSDRVYKNTLTKSGGKVHALNNKIYQDALNTLKLDQLSKLTWITRHMLVTGQVDCLPVCVNALKKMPQYVLLAGSIQRHIYNVSQLNSISITNNLDQCRANLLAVLETPAVELSSYLQQHSTQLQSTEGEQKSD